MTKTIVIGEQQDKAINKPIVFKYHLDDDIKVIISDSDSLPSHFKFIELICKKYDGMLDVMFAYNDVSNRSDGILFIGYWNSGTVK